MQKGEMTGIKMRLVSQIYSDPSSMMPGCWCSVICEASLVSTVSIKHQHLFNKSQMSCLFWQSNAGTVLPSKITSTTLYPGMTFCHQFIIALSLVCNCHDIGTSSICQQCDVQGTNCRIQSALTLITKEKLLGWIEKILESGAGSMSAQYLPAAGNDQHSHTYPCL